MKIVTLVALLIIGLLFLLSFQTVRHVNSTSDDLSVTLTITPIAHHSSDYLTGPVVQASTQPISLSQVTVNASTQPSDPEAIINSKLYSCNANVIGYKLTRDQDYTYGGDHGVPDNAVVTVLPSSTDDQPISSNTFTVQGTFPTPGYYEIGISGYAKFTDSDDHEYSGHKYLHSIYVTVVIVEITDANGHNVTGTEIEIPVGALVSLKAVVTPADVDDNIGGDGGEEWEIEGTFDTPPIVIGSYNQSLSSGQTTPLTNNDLIQDNINLYIIKGGDRSVNYSVSNVDDSSVDADVLFIVDSPTVTSFTGTETTDNPLVHIGTFQNSLLWSFGAGVNNAASAGITYNGTVTTGGIGAGEIQIVQLINNVAAFTNDAAHNGGKVDNLNTNGYVLDDDGHGHIAYHNNIVILGNNDNQSITSNDQPSVSLDGGVNVAETYSFQTYLQYKPTGGIWVTLSEYDWSCSGTAVLPNTNGVPNNGAVWAMNNGMPTTPGTIISGTASSTEPTWSDYYNNVNFN